MIKLKGIGHVNLRVADQEVSKRFYRDLLGFVIAEEDPEHGGTFMALPGQSHAIDLFPVNDHEAAARQTPGVRGLGHIAFRVNSEAALKDAHATLQKHGVAYLTAGCRRPIKMSPACQLEMTLPEGFAGGIRGDGSADERWGAEAARGAAGFGSTAADD